MKIKFFFKNNNYYFNNIKKILKNRRSIIFIINLNAYQYIYLKNNPKLLNREFIILNFRKTFV